MGRNLAMVGKFIITFPRGIEKQKRELRKWLPFLIFGGAYDG